MSLADYHFAMHCECLIRNGMSDEDFEVRPKWNDGTPAHTKKIFHIVDRYDLREEYPIMTMRKLNAKNAIDEILWIYQKKSNNVNDLHSHIWDSWADKNGTIGKAYGYQMAQIHHYPEGGFTQIDKVIYDLKHNPGSRSIMLNLYNHADLSEMNLRPCAYSMTFNVNMNKKHEMVLNGLLNQRSQDVLTANNWNSFQYSILLTMIARECNMIPGKLTHVIADYHIYDRHIPIVKNMIGDYRHSIELKVQEYDPKFLFDHSVYHTIQQDAILALKRIRDYNNSVCLSDIYKNIPYSTPKLIINPDVHNFYDFKVEDFVLQNYQYNPFSYKIPVAV